MKSQPITMPVLSDTMTTGHFVDWKKQVGDPVKKGDVLAEIESDKAVMDLEAFDDGYLAGPLAKPDSDIPVGTVIGYLVDSKEATQTTNPSKPAPTTDKREDNDATPEAAGEHQETDNSPETAAATDSATELPAAPQNATITAAEDHPDSGSDNRHKASPYARGLAHELGLDISRIPPGNNGAVTSREVLAAALSAPDPDLNAGPPFRYKVLTSMHRSVADNMAATTHTPTFRVSAELPIEALQQRAHAKKISFTLLLSRLAALTVAEHPKFNMAYTHLGLAVRERVDVGIAVDVPGGLVTPVIRDAAGANLDELAEQWRILRDKARRQRLVPADYQGATFYISNMGMFAAVRSFEAIVPVGAAAILAIGASHNGNAIMTLSCDHRVVYGADAARFLESLEKRLMEPE